MKLTIKNDCLGIDFHKVFEILKKVEMGTNPPIIIKKAFENSQKVVFIFDNDEMVGFGRALSDGGYQAAIYDVALLPKYQGKGLGRLIIENLISGFSGFNIILYANPGKEDFYRKLNFRKMKTAMALFINPEEKTENGFIE